MAGQSLATDEPPASPTGALILVVDDTPDHMEVARLALQDAGFRVDDASSGSAALERMLRGPPPDLLVTDLFMPEMDGWQLINRLKERPELASIPVVVISGGGAQALVSAPVSAGYLEKPVDPARLVEVVTACLVRRRRRPQGGAPSDG